MYGVAYRFPVKDSPPLLLAVFIAHFAILVLGCYYFKFSWLTLIFFVTLSVSAFLSYRQYLLMTQAPDDLCWSGENWLIQTCAQRKSIVYLDLLGSSWLSSFVCLLHFKADQKDYYWLFTKRGLGAASYRKLCYLVKQNVSKRPE